MSIQLKKLFGKYLNIFQNFLPLYMQLYPEKYCKILILYCNYDSSIIFYKNNYTLFFGGCLSGSIVEYTMSFLGELLFNARWWDYSKRFLNINGRICVITFHSLEDRIVKNFFKEKCAIDQMLQGMPNIHNGMMLP